VRFTFLEAAYTILVVVGGLTALIADRLGWDVLKNAGVIVVFLGVIVFGLDMVVHRRAEIGTRYSSSVNPWKRNTSYLSVSWDGEAGTTTRRSPGSHFVNCSIGTRNSRLGTSTNVCAIRCRCVRRGPEGRGCSMDRIPLEL